MVPRNCSLYIDRDFIDADVEKEGVRVNVGLVVGVADSFTLRRFLLNFDSELCVVSRREVIIKHKNV